MSIYRGVFHWSTHGPSRRALISMKKLNAWALGGTTDIQMVMSWWSLEKLQSVVNLTHNAVNFLNFHLKMPRFAVDHTLIILSRGFFISHVIFNSTMFCPQIKSRVRIQFLSLIFMRHNLYFSKLFYIFQNFNLVRLGQTPFCRVSNTAVNL